nr:MAG TPA: hypothetical protein [Caudoviricetes sp.]
MTINTCIRTFVLPAIHVRRICEVLTSVSVTIKQSHTKLSNRAQTID